MKRTFQQALQHRRSLYALRPTSPISDEKIEEIVRFAVKHVPSAFNSQSTRAVLLMGEEHVRLWRIVVETLSEIVMPTESFERMQKKIATAFASGYGTVLFFEDQRVVRNLQDKFPLYAERFPAWSQQTSAMHQLAIWTMLEDEGFGASLQHYSPLIDDRVHEIWKLPAEWLLIAQMPFGTPVGEPSSKTFEPLDERVIVFR